MKIALGSADEDADKKMMRVFELSLVMHIKQYHAVLN